MIKPSTASPASLVAARPAATAADDSRAVGHESGNSAFSEVMEAQERREEATPAPDEASSAGEADAATAQDTQPEPATAASSDPMLELCAPATAVPMALTAATPAADSAVAAPVAGSSLRAAVDGELQARLGLGTDVLPPVAELSRDTSPQQGAEEGTGTPAGPGAPIGAGEARPAGRPAGAEAAQAAARPPELRAPLGSGVWADELGARVTWMVDRGEQVASLRLSPENLGPLEVRIAVREGETSVWFGAAHSETRAALEQSLPRLREMLGASGLSLADAGVFSHTPQDPQRGFTNAALARAAQESGVDAAAGIVMQVSRRGLVDLYA
jgi:flagellar hook-length control protein FliK